MPAEDAHKEILTQYCQERKETVHSYFISIPIHERRNREQRRGEN
jgi:hypothetical protein